MWIFAFFGPAMQASCISFQSEALVLPADTLKFIAA